MEAFLSHVYIYRYILHRCHIAFLISLWTLYGDKTAGKPLSKTEPFANVWRLCHLIVTSFPCSFNTRVASAGFLNADLRFFLSLSEFLSFSISYIVCIK